MAHDDDALDRDWLAQACHSNGLKIWWYINARLRVGIPAIDRQLVAP